MELFRSNWIKMEHNGMIQLVKNGYNGSNWNRMEFLDQVVTEWNCLDKNGIELNYLDQSGIKWNYLDKIVYLESENIRV